MWQKVENPFANVVAKLKENEHPSFLQLEPGVLLDYGIYHHMLSKYVSLVEKGQTQCNII